MVVLAPAIYPFGVRSPSVGAWLAFVALGLLPGVAAAERDFDPSGRSRRPPPGHHPGGPGPSGKPGTTRKPPQGDDSKASAETLITRYTGIVLAQPSQPFPLQRLAQLYRERDGNLKKLVEEFEKRATATGPDAWPARVALAGILKQDGRYEESTKAYRAAIAERPTDPAAILALAQLEQSRGDKSGARGHFQAALALLKAPAEVEQTNRTLRTLSLELSDFEGAKRYHEALVKASQGSLFVRAELGRELLSQGQFERAEAEFRDVAKAAAGDNRALAPALRDLGQALAKQKKMAEAMTTLKRGLAIAGTAAGVRSEILIIMTDAFRAESKLPELIGLLEAEHPSDFQRLDQMGALYEETGAVDKAITTYRKALGVDGKRIDVRLKLVHLLQTAGELDAAIREYEALIKAAPNNPDFVFELCETLIQRGDRPKALKLVSDLESRAHEEDILSAVADFYERVEEKDKALRVLTKLAQLGGVDPSHIIDLGDRYFQAGDKKRAVETWDRIKVILPNRAQALSTLGEVYLDHDMAPAGLAALEEAVRLDPNNVRYKKALASALERSAAGSGSANNAFYTRARQLWEDLLAQAGSDKVLARDARNHIVGLWALSHELPAQVTYLSNRFMTTPPDVEAGRILAEVLRRLRRLPEAESALRRVVSIAPGDEESLLALERVLVQQQMLPQAIEVLAKLCEVDPKRAREFYQRMAEYAAELYHDDDAITYAARAVELSPKDSIGHQKLGEMYKRRQDVPHAISEFRLAIQQNERLFPVYFDLAEMLLSTGQVDEADRLFRRVVRASSDEELVARAARMSLQVNLGKNTLGELERELLPVALGNPQKPIYRRLLVELYGAMTFPLVQKVKTDGGRSPAAAAARAELSKIGTRAVKPLLDALADDKESQQKIAITVLAYVENKSAGASLYNYAIGAAEKALRVRAMIACGALRDPALLPRYEQILAPKSGTATVLPSDAIAVAAAWGVARMGDRRAEPLLVKLAASSSPEVRALGAIGLGLLHDRKHAPMLTSLARSPEAGPTARAAATHALAEIGAGVDPGLLLANADSSDPLLRRATLLAMAQLGSADMGAVPDAIAAAVFSPDESLRSSGLLAATALATHNYRRGREALPVPDGPLTLHDVLVGMAPEGYSAKETATAFLTMALALRKAAVAAVATSPERARVVADALLTSETKLGLAPFTGALVKLDAKTQRDVDNAIESIAAAVVPGFVALTRHPAVEVRTRAVELLARRVEPEAQAAMIDALEDPDDSVKRTALSAMGRVPSLAMVTAAAKLVQASPSWPLRVRAAEALGRLGGGTALSGGASGKSAAVETLSSAARTDAYALVREAAARALAAIDPVLARPVLDELAKNDPEPAVRAATALLLTPH